MQFLRLKNTVHMYCGGERMETEKSLKTLLMLVYMSTIVLEKASSDLICNDDVNTDELVDQKFAHFFNSSYEISDIMKELMDNKSLSIIYRKR